MLQDEIKHAGENGGPRRGYRSTHETYEAQSSRKLTPEEVDATYRASCEAWLGCSAELVEEMKVSREVVAHHTMRRPARENFTVTCGSPPAHPSK